MFAAKFGLPVAAVLTPVAALFGDEPFSWRRVGEFWLTCALVTATFVAVNRARTARAKSALTAAKHEIDLVGYVVACDLEGWLAPRPFISDTPPETKHVLFPAGYPPIDFSEYDQAFGFFP